ncbi:MAG: flagellinolysin [Clostridia bacterium]|nr:flagellinolysin [Clostridia bacterium]
MRINTNVSALNTWRAMKTNSFQKEKAIEKLATGVRINKAGDDAAGLAISEKMRGQIRGLSKANQNIQDGISLIQTAEGALGEVHSLLQRGRELAVQASNDTLSSQDQNQVQTEITQILNEIDNISQNTQFNTRKLLNAVGFTQSDIDKVVAGLQTGGWLTLAESRINSAYGLAGDGATLTIKFDQGSPGGVLAYVSGTGGAGGKLNNLELHVDLSDFIPVNSDHGGSAPMYNDRIIAHEMVHAIMARSMNFTSLPTWLKEGAAEFIHGADERLKGDIAIAGSINNLVDNNSISGAWVSDSAHYSTAYAATRFLHNVGITNGTQGVRTLMDRLEAGDTLDAAINQATNGVYTSEAAFAAAFQGAAGKAYIATMDLNNADTGAIGGADADGGAPLTATSVINEPTAHTTWTADTSNPNLDVLSGFADAWVYEVASTPLVFQLGANEGDTLQVTLTGATSSDLGISSVNVTTDAQGAITSFDAAINEVSTKRSTFGALQNRLEHAFQVADISKENLSTSESRIRDTDMASEMMKSVKLDILSQAASAMLAQANQAPQGILKLVS